MNHQILRAVATSDPRDPDAISVCDTCDERCAGRSPAECAADRRDSAPVPESWEDAT